MNVQGMADRAKRKDVTVINYLKSKQYSICIIQDTHSLPNKNIFIRSMWGYVTYFSNFNSQSHGVAIFINTNFDYKLISIDKHLAGNLRILNCSICDKNITLVNIYGQDRDNPIFYDYVSENKSKFQDSISILAGDFNLV
jgi:hypothetical protein